MPKPVTIHTIPDNVLDVAIAAFRRESSYTRNEREQMRAALSDLVSENLIPSFDKQVDPFFAGQKSK